MEVLNPKRYLVGAGYDVILLGGGSIIVWLLFLISRNYVSFGPISTHLSGIPATMATLVLLVNYPHFMASYRIAYSQGYDFVKKHWLELILVPIALFLIFLWTFWLISKDLRMYSELMISLMLDLMFLTVGWHYLKQIFGCMMMTARFSDYEITAAQRKILLFHIQTIWIFVFIFGHTAPATQVYLGFDYTSRIVLSKYFLIVLGFVFIGSLATFFWKVIYFNFKKKSVFPGLQFWIPLLAIYIWWLPFFSLELFNSHVVPFFHSLQYLVFVQTYEANSQIGTESKKKTFPVAYIMLGLCLVGFLAFEGVPGLMDNMAGTKEILGATAFFTGAVSIFINIHHYFIDSVIWRMSSPHIRRNLTLEIQPGK